MRKERAQPVTLEGSHVRLEPLSLQHITGLAAVGLDERIWRWNPRPPIQTAADMQRYVEAALNQQATGAALPFATFHKAAGCLVGSTRFHFTESQWSNRCVEIGYTWVAPPWQRSAVNTEAKFLMLRYAFETLRCLPVELKTDSLNERSRNAIRRLGAQEEAVFRNHMVTHSGRIRHSVFFSIIETEWSTVKANLEAKLQRSVPE